MDEALEAAEVVADSELEGAVVWLLRILGILLILGGIGVFLFVDVSLLIPIVMIVVGLLLVTIPGIALELLGG
jgi:hypothetical protein